MEHVVRGKESISGCCDAEQGTPGFQVIIIPPNAKQCKLSRSRSRSLT